MSAKFIALVKKEFLVLLKDWHGLMVLFLMPAAFILIMSLAMADAFGDHSSVAINYTILNQSDEKLPTNLLDSLQDIPGFHAVALAETQHLKDQQLDAVMAGIKDGHYQMAVVIPADFRQRLLKTTLDDPATLAPGVDLLLAPTVKPYIRQLFTAALRAILTRQKIAWLMNSNPDPNAPPTISTSTLDQYSQLNIGARYVYSDTQSGTQLPNAVQQNVPAWLVFAMFFVVIPLSTVFLIERQQGTLMRLRMMNLNPLLLLLGKLVPYYVVNQIQMLVMIMIGMTLVPLLGGQQLNMAHSTIGLLIISSACSLAAIGFALLVATVVKTTIQATTIGGMVNIIFGALGGIMVPKFIMPDTMQSMTNFSPMSWGLEGFLDVFLRQSSWQAVLPESLYLSLFGTLCLAVAAYRFHKDF